MSKKPIIIENKIKVDKKDVYDHFSPETRMSSAKYLSTLMTDKELKTFIEFCQSQFQTAQSKK